MVVRFGVRHRHPGPARQGPERRANAHVRKTRVSKPDGDSARPYMSSCVQDLVIHTLLLAVFITIPLTQQPSVAPPEVKLRTRIDALEYLALIYYFLPRAQLTLLKII